MSPLDNEGMVELLHTHGINMRYLGRMAALAHTQEAQDLDLLRTHRQRIQSMPLYWLEMIEIEILARCFKHYLNRLYRENKDIRQSPSPTIATLLNHILGTSIAPTLTTTNSTTAAATTTTTTTTTTTATSTATTAGTVTAGSAGTGGSISHMSSIESGNDSNIASLSSIERKESSDSDKDNSISTNTKQNINMKKKKSKHTHARENCSASIPELIDAGGSRGDCITALGLLASSRFGLLHPSLLNFKTAIATDRCQNNNKDVGVVVGAEGGSVVDGVEKGVEGGVDGGNVTESQIEHKEGESEAPAGAASEVSAAGVAAADAATEFKLASLPFLHDRITRITLLRRLCQIAGLRIISRDYDFSSPHPFSRDDIVSVVPLVKSAQQSGPIPEVSDILNQARGCLEEGNLTGAFELSQDASRLLNQITGPLHKETVMCTNLITQILLEARNNSLALTMAFKSLSISVQLTGLDSQDAAQHHGQVAALLCDLGYPLKALQHFLVMKYLIELMAGPRHPELVNVYLRLVGIYDQQKEYVTAQVLLAAAKELSVDVSRQCMISTTVAEIYDKMGELTKAVSEQRTVLRTMVQLFGPADEKSIEAKSKVEKYLRKLTISNVNAARGIGNKNISNNSNISNGKGKGKDKVVSKDLEVTKKKSMEDDDMNGKDENKDDDYLQLITDGDTKKDEKKKSNNSTKKKNNKNKNKK